MANLKLEGVHPGIDGTYEFDDTSFTNWELHSIKQLTGLTAGMLREAFERNDNDIVMAMTMVALMRNGRIDSRTPWTSEQVQALWNAEVGAVTATFGEAEEDDALPPESTPDADVAESAKNGSSGEDSWPGSENQASAPSPTGAPR